MLVVLPGCRHLVDGGDRDLGFETASDEGAYHPCPSLAIPPPSGGRPQFDFPQGSSHRFGRHRVGKIRHPFCIISGNSPLPKLGRQAMRSPAPVPRPQLDKALGNPLIVDQIELLTARDGLFDLAGGPISLLQLLHQLAPKVISPRQEVERDLIGGSLSFCHQPLACSTAVS